MFSSLFHVVLYKPIFNIFVALYNIIPGHDVGLVILVVTVIIRLVLYPLTASSIRAQRSMQELQPKLEEIKKQYPDDRQKQAQATMELYKNHKVNPITSCLPVLIQLPILIALYLVLRDGLASAVAADNLYSFIHNPGQINATTLGGLSLAAPSIVLALLAALAQYGQARTMNRKMPPKEPGAGSKDENMMIMMNKQMLYFMPALTAIIGFRLPAGLTLYWFLSTLLMVLQQVYMNREDRTEKKSNVIEGTIVE